jgi:hypothetical protein
MAGTTRSRVNFFMNKFKRRVHRLQRWAQGQQLAAHGRLTRESMPSFKFGMQQDILETFVDRGQLRTRPSLRSTERPSTAWTRDLFDDSEPRGVSN